MAYVLRNATNNTIIGDKIALANTHYTRTKGLLGRRKLEKGEGMIITSCDVIHTYGMKFNIDVLFLDDNKTVVSYATDVGPSRRVWSEAPAEYTVELPAGTIESKKIQIGNKFEW